MKQARGHSEDSDIFGMSFLDVISCALGAVLAMVLIAKDSIVDEIIEPIDSVIIAAPKPIPGPEDLRPLELELDTLLSRRADLVSRITSEKVKAATAITQIIEANVEQSTKRDNAGTVQSVYAGGVPVGRENIIFIIDTSGSMQAQWPLVTETIEDIINMHPQVKGLQILSDNGEYLIPGYKGRWMPDSPTVRKQALNMLTSWTALSNSSPAEGLEVALRTYAKPESDLSIYVMGDDFTGSSYEQVVRVVDRWNVNKNTGLRIATIHAVGFPMGLGDRFGTLMRHVTHENNGVFIGL
jgi:hypothetical protein